MKRLSTLLVLIVALVSTAANPAFAARSDTTARGQSKGGNNLYIVQLLDPPVVAYNGSISGYKATRPNKGQKINPNNPDVIRYASYLDGKHDAKVAAVGGRKVYSYRYSFNGFAAELNTTQAARLSADPEVLAVTKDSIARPDTSNTPTFLGLNAPGGIWSTLSGSAGGSPISGTGPGSGGAGEGVVVGIIDSGIWPENPSFSDRDATGKLVFQQIPGWHGKCTPGEAFPASACGQKLIGAQWFNQGYGGDAGVKAEFSFEFASARDADGHGSHTASTAAGNYGVPVVVDGIDFGTISGMAPRARVASYKVCWGADEGGCFNSDSVAAIDQAVADGVDVLNFSISGSRTSFLDPVEVAFLFAADAGIFVAASAGNEGPGASTVAHNSPWLTTVAASTHTVYEGTLTLGNGAKYNGASISPNLPSSPLITAVAAKTASAPAAEAALCFPGTLDPTKVTGKIVVCDRGVNARTEKSMVVRDAGGVGMVLVNTSLNSLNADLHYVPTIHVQSTARAAILAYADTPGATASFGPVEGSTTQVPSLQDNFSSRGPAVAGAGDILKPDITAPGVDVLAAVSPVGYNGRNYDVISGTSMSSPHIAGIAALFKDLYPTWSPMAIKSALMTAATQTNKSGNPISTSPTTNNVPEFAYGAGHVDPNPSRNPGLVYEAGFNDWLAFLCGTTNGVAASTCAALSGAGYSLDPSDLNYPSIAIGGLAGTQTVKRTVTNVSGSAATFTVSVQAPAGTTVSVSPQSLTIPAGGKASYTVTFTTQAGATLNAYSSGALVWTSGAIKARSPLVVRPVALAAPVSVSGTGAPISYNVTFGYSDAFSATGRGLVPAVVNSGTVAQDPDQTFNPADPAGTAAIPVTIPAGTTYARFALFDSDVAPGSDMDLYVYQGASLVGSSAGGTSAEEVNFSFATPTAGPINLTVYVHGWGLTANPSPFKLHSWYLGTAAAGNMSVSAPATATLGATGQVSLTFSGLAPATRYLGSVVYSGASGMPSPTIIRVDTP